MLKKAGLLVAFIFIISGCATSHMIAPERKLDPKARPDKATLVIIRDTSFGFAIVFWHYLDGKFIGETKGKSYFVTNVNPGPHYIMVSTENTAVAHFDFKPGKIYYLQEGVIMGMWRARTSGFWPLNPQEAAEAMKACAYWEYDPNTKGEDMDAKLYQQAIADYQMEVKQNPDGYKALLNYDGY
jgi:Protein of unknown function (DUF2846)